MKYTVTHKPKEKQPYWVTNSKNEPIASGCKHKERDTADVHCYILNSYFGDENEDIQTNHD